MFDIFENLRNSIKKKWSKYHGKANGKINVRNQTNYGMKTGNALDLDDYNDLEIHKRHVRDTSGCTHVQQNMKLFIICVVLLYGIYNLY